MSDYYDAENSDFRARIAAHNRENPPKALKLVRTNGAHEKQTHIDVDGQRMLAAVHDFIGRFVVYPSNHAHAAHALWIVHTHLMQHWDSTPRIAFLSPEPGSGKSRALEVSELLVPNPVTSVNVSPAYLFRKVGAEEGATILFDEIDTVFGPKAKENEDIRGLLNAGHRNGATAGRCVTAGKTIQTEELPAYAAVAMAGLGWLPDTIMTRSVIVRMRKRHQGERVEPFRRRLVEPEGHAIRRMIEAWARTVTNIDWPQLPPGIEDRDADCWESLIVIGDMVGGDWSVIARQAAVALVAESKNVENKSLGIRLLADLKVVFGDRLQMTTKDLLIGLQAIDEAPWKTINKGQPIDDRKLSNTLRQYGIKSENLVIGDHRPKGYNLADFEDTWLRYLPPVSPAKSATSATSATCPENPANAGADVADVAAVADLRDMGDGANEDLSIPDFLDRAKTRTCSQCGAADDGHLESHQDGGQLVWLHRECVRFWRQDQGAA